MRNKVQFEGRPTWAEISLSALSYNLRAIRRHLASRQGSDGRKQAPPKVLAVVKANAYGHGAARRRHTEADPAADRILGGRRGAGHQAQTDADCDTLRATAVAGARGGEGARDGLVSPEDR